MAQSQLEEARALKKKATALRNRGQFERAKDALDEAIRILEAVVAEQADSDVTGKEVRAELADSHGMKGGVLRRMHALDAALEAYKAGRKVEKQDNLSTYNLSNVITLSILHEQRSPRDPALHADLQAAIQHLRQEVEGPRRDEWWAWSDLAQFYLLDGQLDDARACYAEAISKTGASADEITRHATILRELAQNTAASAPEISRQIEVAIRELAH